jgi:hypothetical protein
MHEKQSVARRTEDSLWPNPQPRGRGLVIVDELEWPSLANRATDEQLHHDPYRE